MLRCLLGFTCWASLLSLKAQPPTDTAVVVGAEVLIKHHVAQLQGKRLAVVAHAASMVFNKVQLVDTLLALGLNLRRVFAPEHGFRGDHEAGQAIVGGRDTRTGLQVVSLYGKRMRPTSEELADVDVVLFDLQDVGTRYYTYLTTLVEVMRACAQQRVPLCVLDRPNPNGDYVAGPLLVPEQKSIVGPLPIPVVHGMTLGELASMAQQQGWLGQDSCKLQVIPLQHYRHALGWQALGRPWVPPSPNLPVAGAARSYPLLCWYEGTVMSVGRGTTLPFQQVGAPWLKGWVATKLPCLGIQPITFIPKSIKGKALSPPWQGQRCYGVSLQLQPTCSGEAAFEDALQLLIALYHAYPPKQQRSFFNSYFDKLAGTPKLREGILQGLQAHQLLLSFAQELAEFKQLRSRYLLYP